MISASLVPVCLSPRFYSNQVLFAGYTIPHPAEDQMHIRIQTAPDYLAQTALKWTCILYTFKHMAAATVHWCLFCQYLFGIYSVKIISTEKWCLEWRNHKVWKTNDHLYIYLIYRHVFSGGLSENEWKYLNERVHKFYCTPQSGWSCNIK